MRICAECNVKCHIVQLIMICYYVECNPMSYYLSEKVPLGYRFDSMHHSKRRSITNSVSLRSSICLKWGMMTLRHSIQRNLELLSTRCALGSLKKCIDTLNLVRMMTLRHSIQSNLELLSTPCALGSLTIVY